MKDKWNELSSREQILLLVGVVFLLFALVYFLYWEPLTQRNEQLRQQLVVNQNDVRWMKHAVGEIKRLQQVGIHQQTKTSGDLLSETADALREAKLQTYNPRVEQLTQTQVRVYFQRVPFDQLILWMTLLWQRHMIGTDTVKLERSGPVAFVSARIVLQRQ